jgi:hypothetical protein
MNLVTRCNHTPRPLLALSTVALGHHSACLPVAPSVSYHFVPGVALRDFALKDAQGSKELISTNDKEPSILKTGARRLLCGERRATVCVRMSLAAVLLHDTHVTCMTLIYF